MKYTDKTGTRYGRLVVLTKAGCKKNKKGRSMVYFLCRCDCGKKKSIRSDSLQSGLTTSCGCYGREKRRERTVTHGLTKHPLYAVWCSMKDRCYNSKNQSHKYYGQRGIHICYEWFRDFKVFFTWAIANGWRKKLQIDRIDNNRGYAPNNCRFVRPRINALNQRTIKVNNTSGYRGVGNSPTSAGNVTSSISVKKKTHYLGVYKTPHEAAIARDNFILNNSLENDYTLQVLTPLGGGKINTKNWEEPETMKE